MTARILIVDDHEVVRQGVRSVLKHSRPEWEICGEATDGIQAIEAVRALKPDVVILDVTMPNMNGLEATPKIIKQANARVLIFTMHESQRIANEVRATGAHGYVQKSQAGRDLVVAIDTLLAGGTFFGRRNTEPKPSGSASILGLLFCEALCCAWLKPKSTT
jgi:DNA-binding NarL/FixJ family response regulator